MSRVTVPRAFAFVMLLAFSIIVGALFFREVLKTPETIGENVRSLQAAPPKLSENVIEVEIPDGADAAQIRKILLRSGVLTDPSAFDTLLLFSDVTAELKAGNYKFHAASPASEVIFRLRKGGIEADLVRIPEGLRVEEIGELLTAAGVGSIEEWDDSVNRPWRHAALIGKPAETSLLGYLLPASYPFQKSTTTDDAIEAMLDAFATQVTPELRRKALVSGMTMHEVLTLASIVEREAALVSEQPLIASVFLNRLDEGMRLQADPTIQFAVSIPESVIEFGWWKIGLTQNDLEADSLYNSYLHTGLPPGPIANPGIDAIIAVLEPADTEFLFFVADPACDGSHRFSVTLNVHNHNASVFNASGCAR